MESELVSVIIPTYNRADFLKEAIESVLAQTYENYELLILDNCSPDHTLDVVESFKDPRIKYLRHQCNIGSAANWAYGVHWAQGEYLSILGDDDKYRPDFLVRRVQGFSKTKNVAVVFSSYDICDENGRIISSSEARRHEETVMNGRDLVAHAAHAKGGWHIGASLYRRNIVVPLWNYTTLSGKAGDTALNIRIALNPENYGVWIPDRGLIYRRHPGQDMITGVKYVWIGHIRACKEPVENGDADEYRDILRGGLVRANNILGRIAWNRGQVKMARRYFARELMANPLRFFTWLLLFYTFLARPKPISPRTKQDTEITTNAVFFSKRAYKILKYLKKTIRYNLR